MEISPIIAQEALRGLERVVFSAAAVIVALGLARRGYLTSASGLHSLKDAGRSLRAHVTWRALPLIGLPAAFPAPDAAASTTPFTGLDRLSFDRSIEPPWAGVSGFSPPRLLARPHGSTAARGYVHPAIHGSKRAVAHPRGEEAIETRVASPLFPRARASSAQVTRHRVRIPIEKRRAMSVHPAGSGFRRADIPPRDRKDRSEQPGRRHVVRRGETLWGIAGDALGTSDARRIARYWPLIHRANRDVIGRNPDLIYPGQVLHLPPEK